MVGHLFVKSNNYRPTAADLHHGMMNMYTLTIWMWQTTLINTHTSVAAASAFIVLLTSVSTSHTPSTRRRSDLLAILYGWLFRPGGGAKYSGQRVCPSVCSSACISQTPHVQIAPHFPCTMSPEAVARSSAGIGIRYVLPVLWMTSYVYIMQGIIGQNQRRHV